MSVRSSSASAPRAGRPADGVRGRTAARAPSAAARARATTVLLGEAEASSVASIMAVLPDPATLTTGALVIVTSEIAPVRPAGPLALGRSLARSVLSIFGRARKVTRAQRCSALVARGYVDVGAAEDAHADLTWGYAPETTKAPVSEET